MLYTEAFTQNHAGYATSMAVVLTVITLAVSVVVTRLQAREEA